MHGTLRKHVPSIRAGVSLANSRSNLDFGIGFYTTTSERQAEDRSWQLSQRRGGHPAVIRFNVNREELAALKILCFVRGEHGFWKFIRYCRMGKPGHARRPSPRFYDVVVGPVAASWRQQIIMRDSDQISFHTQMAVDLLNRSHPVSIKIKRAIP
jgi:Protein of unknown function (DUF3990)